MLVTPRPGAHRDNISRSLQQVHQEASNLQGVRTNTAYELLLKYLEWVTGAVRLLQDQVSGGDIDRLITHRSQLPGADDDTPLLAVARSGCTAEGVLHLTPEDLLAAWAGPEGLTT